MKIEIIEFQDTITPEKLKKYSKDPTIFAVYNIHNFMLGLYAQNNYAITNVPQYNECYKIRPFKYFYDKAINSDNGDIDICALCHSISIGKYELIRIKEE